MLSPKQRTLARGALYYVRARLRGENVCSSATIFLTLRCNSECGYCATTENRSRPEMDTGEVIRLMAGLRRQGTFRLGLSGGEPLLRADFDEIAHAAQRLGFLTSLVTNGLLLERFLAAAMRLDYVLCTIEGDAATHDAQRGEGAWDKTTQGLQALRALGHKHLGVICPVYGANHTQLEIPLAIAEALGGRVFFQPLERVPGSRGESFSPRLPAERQRELFTQISDWKRSGRPIGNSWRSLAAVLEPKPSQAESDCLAGRYFHLFLPDGTALPCGTISWAEYGEPTDLDDPRATIRKLARPNCQGCTISPYLEQSYLLEPHLPTVLNALRWG